MNTRQKVLEDALKCVNGEREKQYGNPEDNFKRIADRWSLYLTDLYKDEGVVIELEPIDVARMMIDFKLARANGPKDKLDNYIDMIGYAACAAEIFEKDNEDKTDDYIKNPYSYFHNSLVKYASAKAEEKNIPFDNLKSIDRNLPREFSDLLHQAVEDCVSEGKYGRMKLLDYYKKIDELFEKYKPEIAESKMAESRSCSKKASDNIRDFFKQVAPVEFNHQSSDSDIIGNATIDSEGIHSRLKPAYVVFDSNTKLSVEDKHEISKTIDDMVAKALGKKESFKQVAPGTVTNKEEFDACMTAYQHYIYNKTKETREAIDKCMCDQVKKDTYSYFHDKLANYISVKAKEEHVLLEMLKDLDRKFPRKLSEYLDQAATDCVINGKKIIDCYKEIDELFVKYINTDKKEDTSFLKTYESIISLIVSSSNKANVNLFDVVDCLIKNNHAPTDMAALSLAGKIEFDDVASYVDDAIKEVKKKGCVESGS